MGIIGLRHYAFYLLLLRSFTVSDSSVVADDSGISPRSRQ
jgi:hypothetical protein